MERKAYTIARSASLAATCLALNVGLGKVSNLLSLPVTFDTIGTILAAVLLPWYMVLAVGCLSSFLGSLFIHPAFLFYTGTQVAIGLAAIVAVRLNLFSASWKAALTGLGIGVLSAAVSAPVTVIVFGGVAVPSITALNTVFLASGRSLWQSVLGGSMIVESLDKFFAGFGVWLILRRMPRRMTGRPNS